MNVQTRKTTLTAVAILLLIAVVQVWIISAGQWWSWPTYSDDYSRLADGFLRGRLGLMVEPPPQLLALPNPYDAIANRRYRWNDALLFNGKYYLYWGPVPALLIAAVCWPLRISMPDFGDQYIVFAALLGTVVCSAILIWCIRRQLFPQQKSQTAAVAIVSLGLGTPVMYLLGRAAIYEAAIAAGQFFLVLGVLLAFLALTRPRRAVMFMAGASVSLALSAGSRISLAPAVAAIAIATLSYLLRRHQRPVAIAAALVLPLVLSAAIFAWYNDARFGSIIEFGHRYQLAAAGYDAQSPAFLAIHQIVPNLYDYLFAAPMRLNTFPYVWAYRQRPWMADFFGIPHRFAYEPVVGLAWSQPFLIFALLAIFVRRAATETALSTWLTLALVGGAVFGFAPAVSMDICTMRYLLDAVPCLTILAAIGYWRVLSRFSHDSRGPREIWSAARLAVGWQSFLGILLAVSGYYGQFSTFNPALLHALHSFFPKVVL